MNNNCFDALSSCRVGVRKKFFVECGYPLNYVEGVKDLLPVIRFEIVKTLLELQLWVAQRFVWWVVRSLSNTTNGRRKSTLRVIDALRIQLHHRDRTCIKWSGCLSFYFGVAHYFQRRLLYRSLVLLLQSNLFVFNFYCVLLRRESSGFHRPSLVLLLLKRLISSSVGSSLFPLDLLPLGKVVGCWVFLFTRHAVSDWRWVWAQVAEAERLVSLLRVDHVVLFLPQVCSCWLVSKHSDVMLTCCFLRLYSTILDSFWSVKPFHFFLLLELVYLWSIFVLKSAFQQLQAFVYCCPINVKAAWSSWWLRHVLLLLFKLRVRNALICKCLASHLLLVETVRTLLDTDKLFGIGICLLDYFAFNTSLPAFIRVNDSSNFLSLLRHVWCCCLSGRQFLLISIDRCCLWHRTSSVYIKSLECTSFVDACQLWSCSFLASAFLS